MRQRPVLEVEIDAERGAQAAPSGRRDANRAGVAPPCEPAQLQATPPDFRADEACDVGCDTGSPASPDYGPTGNKFSDQIDWVQIDIGDDSQDHLIQPEDRLTIAMARQ